MAVALSSLPSCVSGLVGDDSDGKSDNLWTEHKAATISAFVDILLPADDDSPGGVETNALGTLGITRYVTVIVNAGFISALPPNVIQNLEHIDAFVASIITADLDTGAILHGAKLFVDLPRDVQEQLVADRYEGALRPLFQFVRAATFISYLAPPFNDLGLQAIGLPAYKDFDDSLHSSGFADYSMNLIPSHGGVQAWSITIDGNLP